MSLFCDKCSFKNQTSAKFCKGCGGELVHTNSEGTLIPGVVLDSRYEIKRLVKSGGMGAVYEAIDRRFSNSLCAVKEMLDLSSKEEERDYLIKRFKEEAEILHNLRHSGLPAVKDYFVEAGRYYLVMSYIEGKDLATLMEEYEDKKVPVPLVIEWTKQLLEVLIYLHNQPVPVVYRDMKPANVMLQDSDKKIMLIDFGIARNINPESQTTKTTIGTPAFAPPELFEGRPEPRTDLYSLGATMHCLLSGKIPLSPYSFKKLRDFNPGVPEELEAIIEKALELNLENRYKNAEEMKEALDSLNLDRSSRGTTSDQATILPENYRALPAVSSPEKIKSVKKYSVGKRSIIKITLFAVIVFILTLSVFIYLNVTGKACEKGMAFFEEGRYEEALQFFDKAFISRPAESLLGKGLVFYKEGKYEEAIKCFDDAMGYKEDYVTALAYKGLTLTFQGKDKEGQECIDNASKISSDSLILLYVKGHVLIYQEEYYKAIEFFNKALKIDPKYAEAFYGKGLALSGAEDYKEAIKYFDKALKIKPRYVDIWNNKAMALYNYGNKIKLQKKVDDLMKENKKDSDPKIYLYITDSNYDYGEQYNNALECLDKALEINPDHSVAWYNKGYILYSFKEDEDALECFGKALENNPSYIEAWNMKGNVLSSMGEGEGAKECYTRAEKLKEEKDEQN